MGCGPERQPRQMRTPVATGVVKCALNGVKKLLSYGILAQWGRVKKVEYFAKPSQKHQR